MSPGGLTEGLIAPVDPSDLENVWKVAQEILKLHRKHGVIVGPKVYANVCSPGANVMAVWSRASILLFLGEQVGLFRPKLPGEVRKVIFNVFAKFPIKQLEPGVVHKGFPLDVQEFMKQVEDELRRLGFKVDCWTH